MRCAWAQIDPGGLDRVAAAPSARAPQGRAFIEHFEGSTGPLLVKVERVGALEDGLPLSGSPAEWGFWKLEGDRLRAHVPDEPFAAEAVLRIAWQVATHRLGGVLFHGSAFAFGAHGIAAIGASGDGKSTLARLCTEGPAHAQLLTDEIVQLFPDGRMFGTPFHSDYARPGAPGEATLASLLVLEKGPHEALAPVEPMAALPKLLGQLYAPVNAEVSRAELSRRVMAIVDRAGVQKLTFRKHEAVGTFLKEQLAR